MTTLGPSHDLGMAFDADSTSFVALDFELANGSHASVCAAGVARVVDGQVTAKKHWFIRPVPPYDFLHGFNADLTGISVEDLADGSRFDQIAMALLRNIQPGVVVCHGATSADLSMFDQTWWASGLGASPSWDFVCTLAVARAVLPDLESHRVPVVYEELLGEPMDGAHHRADDDAEATAKVLMALLERSGTDLDAWVRHRAGKPPKTLRPPRVSDSTVPVPART